MAHLSNGACISPLEKYDPMGDTVLTDLRLIWKYGGEGETVLTIETISTVGIDA